jgi:predicted metallo-beta-lactamase superfamily hydrolase
MGKYLDRLFDTYGPLYPKFGDSTQTQVSKFKNLLNIHYDLLISFGPPTGLYSLRRPKARRTLEFTVRELERQVARVVEKRRLERKIDDQKRYQARLERQQRQVHEQGDLLRRPLHSLRPPLPNPR